MNHRLNTHLKLKNRQAKVLTALLLIPSIVLIGCGSSKVDSTTISIDKDGKVVSTIIEDFGESYYDLQELSDMATKEASVYNSDFMNDKVFLESVSKDEETGKVTMVLSYNSASDYSHFNQVSLFYGTVSEALEKGYKISEQLVDKDGNTLGEAGIQEHLDNHIIISSDKSNIKVPYNISYMSKGTNLKGKKEALFTEVSTDSAQLLLSK
ncbi:hypothetical protein [Butyrivibrio sp. AE3009]|uniref:hypothetical protein n=1 Tax=Butyrivibrio sp. AE3009 TaxID=1280666 RepID=UPI0003B66DE5|nr:hypothetical protein [Butyrivibrio sp. AE3009]